MKRKVTCDLCGKRIKRDKEGNLLAIRSHFTKAVYHWPTDCPKLSKRALK